MGWDIHFFNPVKMGDILEDKEFTFENSVLSIIDDGGEESYLFLPKVPKEDYLDYEIDYGCATYGANIRPLLWKLYREFGIMFADTCFDEYFYLCDYCENDDEMLVLQNYCIANEMFHMFGPFLANDELMHSFIKNGKPLSEKLYERYKDAHNLPQEEKFGFEHREPPKPEHRDIDDEGLPF